MEKIILIDKQHLLFQGKVDLNRMQAFKNASLKNKPQITSRHRF